MMESIKAEIRDEADIIDIAIQLDQHKNPMASASARALRGVGLPMHRYVREEVDRWRCVDDAANSLMGIGKVVASNLAHLIMSMTEGGGSRNKLKESLIGMLTSEIDRSIKINEEAGNG